jgi:hypothetical protein
MVGCAPQRYAIQRAQDLGDVFRLNGGIGLGALANVQATRYVAVGLGEYRTDRFGAVRGEYGAWSEERADYNFVVPGWGYTRVGRVYWGNLRSSRVPEMVIPRMGRTIDDATRGAAEVSVNVHALLVGIDAGVDFGELADFLVGFAGLDPMGDDARRAAVAAWSSSAWLRARAAEQLGDRPGVNSENALAHMLKDPVAEVRAHAARSLGRLGGERVLPPLVEALQDRDAGVRQEALRAVEKISDRKFENVEDALDWWRQRSQKPEGAQPERRKP